MSEERPRGVLPSPDAILIELDNALRTVFASAHAVSTAPASQADAPLDENERRLSGQLMRVNHTGEVCAQALYRGQLAVARDERVRALLKRAADEETDHLAWTEQRLDELGARRSVLNAVFYLNSFALGALSGLSGDRWSLGFVAETERQVERHLQAHLERLPSQDQRSRAIVEQMKHDEARHGTSARAQGAAELPFPIRVAMQAMAKLMTSTTRWL
jgi:ubiquinone biosynthesis monooxygenase Coq7